MESINQFQKAWFGNSEWTWKKKKQENKKMQAWLRAGLVRLVTSAEQFKRFCMYCIFLIEN